MLQRPGQRGNYRPPPLLLWRVPEAMARLRRILPALPEGAAIEHFLPPAADNQPQHTALQRRAALASTLMAGLELAREGSACLKQGQPFGRIVVTSALRPVR